MGYSSNEILMIHSAKNDGQVFGDSITLPQAIFWNWNWKQPVLSVVWFLEAAEPPTSTIE